MMDMPMKDDDKEPSFKCPACGETLMVETKDEDDSEDKGMAPKKKMNAGSMPMGDLRSKIQPKPTVSNPPNLNSY